LRLQRMGEAIRRNPLGVVSARVLEARTDRVGCMDRAPLRTTRANGPFGWTSHASEAIALRP